MNGGYIYEHRFKDQKYYGRVLISYLFDDDSGVEKGREKEYLLKYIDCSAHKEIISFIRDGLSLENKDKSFYASLMKVMEGFGERDIELLRKNSIFFSQSNDNPMHRFIDFIGQMKI